MPAAFAETADNSFSVTLHGRVQLRGGSIPKSKMDRFLIRLTPADKECPMPKGSSDYFDAEAVGYAREVDVVFPITFTKLGVYHYTITQIPKNINPNLTYDRRTYDVTVSVFNGENGIETAVAMRLNGSEAKTDLAFFVNKYSSKPGTLTPTGVSQNWPWLVAGCAALLIAAAFVFRSLRKKEGGAQ